MSTAADATLPLHIPTDCILANLFAWPVSADFASAHTYGLHHAMVDGVPYDSLFASAHTYGLHQQR